MAIAYHNLGRLEIGKNYTGKALTGTESMARLDPSKPADGSYVVTAVVTESEDPGVALRAAQSAFTSHKDALASELAKIIRFDDRRGGDGP